MSNLEDIQRTTDRELLWLVREKFDAMNQAEDTNEYDALDAECDVLLAEMKARGLSLSDIPPAGMSRS